MTETEIALVLSPRAWRALLHDPSLRPCTPAQQKLRAIYFDTPRQELWANRVGLRLRREGSGWVQTLKWSGGGPLDRMEQNHPVPGRSAALLPALDGAALGDRPRVWVAVETALALGRTPKKGAEAVALPVQDLLPLLRPQFESEVVRRRFLCEAHGSLLEFSFDHGELRLPVGHPPPSGDRTRRIHEVEIELKEGMPWALWQKAEELLRAFPDEVHIEPRSKAERGSLLGADGDAFRVPKALLPKAVGLKTSAGLLGQGHAGSPLPARTAADAFAEALTVAYARLSRAAVDILEGTSPSGPHQLRVAVRRLRSVLKLVQPMLASELWASTQDDLRWIAGAAGPLRDRDVLEHEVLAPLRVALPKDPALEHLGAALDASRERAREDLRCALRSLRFQQLLLVLGQSVGLSLPQLAALEVEAFAQAQMRRLKKKIRRREQAVGPSGEGLHELRLAHKAMRYGATWLAGLVPGSSVAADALALRAKSSELQEVLGSAQDALVGVPLVRTLVADARELMSVEEQHRAVALVEGWLLGRSAEGPPRAR